ncbi:MAG: cohesin domain-containing protein [Bacteroidetes bacterium]|nr:cohesin domain-containing protein [Bacteroidota bacterium]
MKSENYRIKGKRRTGSMIWRFSVIAMVLISALQIPVKGATINCYPQQIDFWSGTVNNSYIKYQSSLIHIVGANGDRGWMKFDISGIPVGSTINSVTVKYMVTSMNYPYYYIRRVTSDPVNFNVTSPNAGWNTRLLGGTVNTDLAGALASGWFALGFHEYEGDPYWMWVDGQAQINTKPYLIVNYTTNFNYDIAVDSITSPPNMSCEGTWQLRARLLNAGIQTLTSATVTWSVNGGSTTTYNWTGVLASGTTTTITLGTLAFSPGNTLISVQASNPNGQQDQFLNNNNKNNIVQIIPKPSIYQQPISQATPVGGNVTFGMVGSGGNITYQWQLSIDGGQTFNSLSATPPYSNVTTNNLLVTNCVQSMNGYKYRCVVTGMCQPEAITDTVTLSVGPPIIAKAVTSYACPGGSALVPVRVQNLTLGTGFNLTINYNTSNINYLTYNGVTPLLNGAFTVTYTPGQVVMQWVGTSPVTIADGVICNLSFGYTNNSTLIFDTLVSNHCVFTGSGGVIYPSHYSNGSVTNGTPTIISQPNDELAIVNHPTGFKVVASGLPNFQWQISTNNALSWSDLTDNAVYQGVITDSLTILVPTLLMNGYRYRCKLTGCGSTIYSNQNTPPALNGALLSVIRLVKTWIDTTYSCPCATPYPQIQIPIYVSNFDSINSVSLHLEYKNTALEYDGVTNINPALLNGFLVTNNIANYPTPTLSTFALAYFNSNTVISIPDNGILFTLKFKVHCDTSKLQWETWTNGACQYSTQIGEQITTFEAQFTNGFVLNGGPIITSQPVTPPAVFTGDTATITTMAVTYGGAPIGYQWQEKSPSGSWTNITNGTFTNAVYLGATTRILKIKPLLVTMTGYQYRCKVFGLCEPIYTNAVTMTVNLPPIYVNIPQIKACSGDTIIVPIMVTNFKQVCSLSLVLNFNNTLMSFAKYSNKNPVFLPDTGNFMINSSGSSVFLSYTTLTPRTITGTSLLVNLKFVSSQLFANSPLTWVGAPTCLISNCNAPPGNVISSVFNNSTVSVNALPQSHNVITLNPAAGHFCSGSNGTSVGLDATQIGINYTLYRDGNTVAPHINWPGNGFGYTFGLFTTPGQYRVLAQNPTTGCAKWMDGWVDLIADPVLTLFTVTGGGSYCTGGIGQPVGVSGSQTGVDYALNLNGTPVTTLVGTGSALAFGNQTTAGTYTVTARYTGYETCPTTMSPSVTISINPYPDAAGTISGNTPICQGTNVVNYSITGIPNATTYIWTLPSGATGSSLTTTIPVTFPPGSVSGNITVRGHNICGDGATSTLPIVVNPLPATPGAISGITTVCQGAQGVPYSISAIADADTYIWTMPNTGNGWTLASTTGGGTGITVNVATNASTGTLSVKGHNACGDGPTASQVILISPLPGPAVSISGNQIPCQGLSYFYSTPVISNSTSYEWSLPPGATGSSVTNTISVSYSTTATSGNITVNGKNSCNGGVSFTLPITISPLPSAALTLSGPSSVCKNTSNVNYTITAIPNATSYSWTTFPPNVTGSSSTTGFTNTLNFPSTASSGNITVKGHNSCGDGVALTFPVTVNILPTVTLNNFPTACSENNALILTGGSPSGGTYSGNAYITNGVFNPQAAGVGTHNIVYTFTDTYTTCQNTTTKTIQVSVFPRITGLVKYDNSFLTPLGNVWVIRKTSSNVVIDSTLTQIGVGDYWFRCLTGGTYNLSARTTIPWAGTAVNASDALMVAQTAVGQITLSALRTKAADVNNNGALNATDALIIMRRFVGLIPSFSIADWQFETIPAAVVSSGEVTRSFFAICAGDVNGSYLPTGVKIKPTVFLEKQGSIKVSELDVFDLPIRAKSSITMNAFSFALNYPEDDMEVLQIKSRLNGFIYNVIDGQIRIAWYGLQAVEFSKDEALFTLTMRMRNGSDNSSLLPFKLDPATELAGSDGKALVDTRLTIPDVRMNSGNPDLSIPDHFYLGTNHPNPFSHRTEIDYYLPTEGQVKLCILNLLGEEIKVIVNEKQAAGKYTSTFDGNGYVPGIYLYKLEVQGKNDHFLQSKPMVIKD